MPDTKTVVLHDGRERFDRVSDFLVGLWKFRPWDRDEQIAEINKKRKAYREQAKKQDDAEFYLVVVFSDRAEVDGFLSRLGLPLDQRYLDGLQLAERVQ